jgi:hypothetical protein
MPCVLGLLFLSWTAAIATCPGADLDFTEADAEEDLPDMNYVKAQAEAGRPRSQTQLADFYLALSDFTNAVPWYQKAAEQNYVPAQLSLAGCLLSGRGTERNPATASQWLRRAADLIEARKPMTNVAARGVLPPALPSVVRTPQAVVTPPAPGIVPSKTEIISTNTLSPRPASVVSTTRTNLPQVRRINTLLAAEPDLLEIPAGLRPPSDSR